MYYTVIKHSDHLRTLDKCRKHSPAARVFYISLEFSNARRVLSQCNTRLRLLYLLNRNTSESLGEREMLWEHEPQASVSTAFSSSPKLSCFYNSIGTRRICFLFLLENTATKKKKNNLFTSIIKM